MKTEPSYIFQYSLLTKEVFIIYKYKEDLNYINHEELYATRCHGLDSWAGQSIHWPLNSLGIAMPWTRSLTKAIYPGGTKMDSSFQTL